MKYELEIWNDAFEMSLKFNMTTGDFWYYYREYQWEEESDYTPAEVDMVIGQWVDQDIDRVRNWPSHLQLGDASVRVYGTMLAFIVRNCHVIVDVATGALK